MKLLDNGNVAFSKADGTIVMVDKGFVLVNHEASIKNVWTTDGKELYEPREITKGELHLKSKVSTVICTHGFQLDGVPEIELVDFDALANGYSVNWLVDFINGYNKRAETHLFTLEQMEKAIKMARMVSESDIHFESKYSKKQIIQSVQVPEYLEFETSRVRFPKGDDSWEDIRTLKPNANGKIVPVLIKY